MDNREKFEALFPIKFKITKEIFNKGKKNLINRKKCIGALALAEAVGGKLPFDVQCTWGLRYGTCNFKYGRKGTLSLGVTTKEEYDITQLEKPTTVTFILE